MTPLRYEITIQAPPAIVWSHLTTRDGLLRWIGTEAEADPRPGGILTWTHENGATMVGRFVELEPTHRMVFRYGWEGDRMGVAPESTTVTVELAAVGEATRVELTHADLPGATVEDHQAGWEHFLGLLADRLGQPDDA